MRVPILPPTALDGLLAGQQLRLLHGSDRHGLVADAHKADQVLEKVVA